MPAQDIDPNINAALRRPFGGDSITHVGSRLANSLNRAITNVVPALVRLGTSVCPWARRIHESVDRPNGASQRRPNHERNRVPSLPW
jgi:hypothetical protein